MKNTATGTKITAIPATKENTVIQNEPNKQTGNKRKKEIFFVATGLCI